MTSANIGTITKVHGQFCFENELKIDDFFELVIGIIQTHGISILVPKFVGTFDATIFSVGVILVKDGQKNFVSKITLVGFGGVSIGRVESIIEFHAITQSTSSRANEVVEVDGFTCLVLGTTEMRKTRGGGSATGAIDGLVEHFARVAAEAGTDDDDF